MAVGQKQPLYYVARCRELLNHELTHEDRPVLSHHLPLKQRDSLDPRTEQGWVAVVVPLSMDHPCKALHVDSAAALVAFELSQRPAHHPRFLHCLAQACMLNSTVDDKNIASMNKHAISFRFMSM